MNEPQTVTIPITQTISTDGANGYQYIPNGTIQFPGNVTISPWPSGGSGVTSWPMGNGDIKTKKPRKPRTKKVLPAHEQEMKDAEAKWKKILDGKK